MRRADRLFQIVQYLRARRITTAEWLANKLETSTRTIYRDVRDLIASGVPIEGEAGIGYVIRQKLDLPPLMFDRKELAALELGLRFVHAYTDSPFASSASSAMAKIRCVLPGTVAQDVSKGHIYVSRKPREGSPFLMALLAAIEVKHKLDIEYRDEKGNVTRRVVRPLGVFFWLDAWGFLAWCELREDFRNFRLDRLKNITTSEIVFCDEPGKRLIDYFRRMEIEHSIPLSDFDPEH